MLRYPNFEKLFASNHDIATNARSALIHKVF
jgi:hypothetical protein